MTTTISNSRMFRATVSVNDDLLKAMKNSSQLATKSIQAGADYWHTKILPKHFEKEAHGKYGYADRTRKYLRSGKKFNKPDLVYSGSLRRDLKSRAAFKIGSADVTLVMSARVLNLVPNMPENSADHYVWHGSKNGRGRSFPNMKREIKILLDDEREAIAAVVTRELEFYFNTPAALYKPASVSAADLSPIPLS